MAKENKGFLFFHDWRVAFKNLSADDCQAILLAMIDYSEGGIEPPEFEGVAQMAAAFIFPAMKRYKQSVDAGRRGGQATASKSASEDAVKGAGKAKSTTKHNDTIQNDTGQDTNTRQNGYKKQAFSDRHFDEFWTCYPKKVGKEAARKAWEKLAPDDALLEMIVHALELQKRSAQWCRDGGQFIPNPSTWLNQKRWEDDVYPVHLTGAENAQPDYTDPSRYENISFE